MPALWVSSPLPAGGCLGILNYEVNLRELSNAIALWLGISPPGAGGVAEWMCCEGDWRVGVLRG